MELLLPSPVQELKHELLSAKELRLFLKRDDLIHPYVSGNKWRKLKYQLINAKEQEKNHLVTFGGAYSNHLLAIAFAAKVQNLKSSGFVRGDEHRELNPLLIKCIELGMQLIPVDRTAYRYKQELFKQFFSDDMGAYFIDEGGSSPLALNGVAELLNELTDEYDHIFTACGTGSTLAGIAKGIAKKGLNTRVEGISVLKGADFLNNDINLLIPGIDNWNIHLEYHQGGYAKASPEFTRWVKDLSEEINIPFEPVYTGKLFYALFDLIKNNYFKKGKKILTIHTGGVHTF